MDSNTQGAESLLGPLLQYGWDYLLISFAITLFGALLHYAKKCFRSEADWDTYWQNNLKNTLMSLTAALSAYIGILLTDPGASLLTFAAIGYTTDSVANKGPASRKSKNV